MADDPKSDLVMQFVLDGRPVLAECALDKHPKDEFMTDFKPADYDTYSNFFEVQKFSFGVEVKDEDSTKAKGQAQAGATTSAGANVQAHGHGHGQTQAGAAAAQKGKDKTKGAFRSWRSATDEQVKNALKFPFETDAFSITRLIDRASPVFFEACCNSQTFDTATLVKRIAVGSGLSSNSSLRVNTGAAAMGFLQIKFSKVLIVNLDWDDGDMITESCEFICQGFEVKYKRQKGDGSLDAAVSASWDYVRDSLPSGQGVS